MKNLLIASAIVVSSLTLVGCNKPSQEKSFKAPAVTQKETPKTSEHYNAYSESAVPTDAPYVLFFHADWCPTCVRWEKNFLAETDLDEDVVVFKVDYDTNQELAKQYGVTKQSTAVFIGADGTVVKTMKDPKVDEVEDFFEDLEDEDDHDEEKEDKSVPSEADTSKTTEEKAETVEETVSASAMYKAYSAADVPEGKPYALYFHASWCPSCVAFGKKIEASIDTLPAGTVVLKTDYDTEQELKQKYGVTSQHTLVTINADGSVAGVKQGAGVDDVQAFFQ